MLALAVSLLFGFAAIAALVVIALAFHAAAMRTPQILAELAQLEESPRPTVAAWTRPSQATPRLRLVAA